MGKSLKEYAKKNKIKYFMISFTDILEHKEQKLVPSQVISEMEKDGAGFAGFATWLDMTPAHPDMLAIPDPKSVIQLPWQPDVAWLASDLVMEGKEVLQAPRNVLKKLITEANTKKFRVKTGIEAEFFLIKRDGSAISDEYDNAENLAMTNKR